MHRKQSLSRGYAGEGYDPAAIPGYTIYVAGDQTRASDWTSSFPTPSNGRRNVELVAVPDTINGALAPTQSGEYTINLAITFIPSSNLIPETVTRDITEEIDVRVTEQNLSIIIERPNAELEYPAQPPGGGNLYPIPIRATITNPESPLSTVAFRLDTLPWTTRAEVNALELVLEDTAYLPPVWGGFHTLYISAETASGDTLSASTSFTIPFDNSSIPLNPHRWDGGGDGINWGDPENWEEDRLPGINDRAIVDLPGTNVVQLFPEQYGSQEETYYTAGAISINAKLVLVNSAVLRIHRANPEAGETVRSSVNGAMAFESASYWGQAPRIELTAAEGRHDLTLTDTLYLSSAFFRVSDVGSADTEFRINVENIAYDNTNQGGRISGLAGNTTMTLEGATYMSRQWSWVFEETHDRSPTLVNQGTMTFVAGTDFGSFGQSSQGTLENRGTMRFKRQATVSTIRFEDIHFAQTFGSTIIDTMGLGFGNLSGMDFYRCSGHLSGVRAKGELRLEQGDMYISNSNTRGVRVEGTNTDYGVLRLERDNRSLGTIYSNFGIISTNLDEAGSSAQIQNLVLYTGAILQIENPGFPDRSVDIDSLILWGGAITIDDHDSLKLGYLEWRSGSILGAESSRTVIRPQSSGAVSKIILGTNEGVFTGALEVLGGAQIDFETGNIKGVNEERVYVTINENGVFRFVNNFADTSWNLPENGQQGWVYFLSFGTIVKSGSHTAQVQGCRYPHTNGVVDIQDGVLEFVRQGSPSWTCD